MLKNANSYNSNVNFFKIMNHTNKNSFVIKILGFLKTYYVRFNNKFTVNILTNYNKVEFNKNNIIQPCNKLEFHNLHISPFLNNILSDFTPYCRMNQITLKLNSSIPTSKIITIDERKLYIIITNLLTNAVKNAYKGTGIVLDTYINSHNVLSIAVINKGKGIPKGEIDRIFNRFYQVNLNKKPNGFGIGLTYSNELAIRLGGEIIVNSIVEKETSFTFKVPLKKTIYQNQRNAQ